MLGTANAGGDAEGAFGSTCRKRVTDGIRTRDVQDHNLALYQLSYGHRRLDFRGVFWRWIGAKSIGSRSVLRGVRRAGRAPLLPPCSPPALPLLRAPTQAGRCR